MESENVSTNWKLSPDFNLALQESLIFAAECVEDATALIGDAILHNPERDTFFRNPEFTEFRANLEAHPDLVKFLIEKRVPTKYFSCEAASEHRGIFFFHGVFAWLDFLHDQNGDLPDLQSRFERLLRYLGWDADVTGIVPRLHDMHQSWVSGVAEMQRLRALNVSTKAVFNKNTPANFAPLFHHNYPKHLRPAIFNGFAIFVESPAPADHMFRDALINSYPKSASPFVLTRTELVNDFKLMA